MQPQEPPSHQRASTEVTETTSQGKLDKTEEERRGSIARERNWEAINKSRSEADGVAKQKQLGRMRRRKSLLDDPHHKNQEVEGAEYCPGDGKTASLRPRSAEQPFLDDNSKGKVEESENVNTSKCGAEGGERGRFSIHNFDPARIAQIEEAKAKRQRAMDYGNSALKTTTIEGQLKELNRQILADAISTIGCERATLMFVDAAAQELFFFDKDQRISFSLRKGISGHCASTGVGVVANDPYSHEFFNPEVCGC